MSDEEATTGGVLTDHTSFVPQTDDEENLWPVHEIIGESKAKYKVLWVGNDPATGKPWPPGWVAKPDCTDDLVEKWRARNRCKEAGVSKKGSGGPAETSNKALPQAKALSKRKRQSEEPSLQLDEPEDVAVSQASKKRKQTMQAQASSRMKIGPPRGAPKMTSKEVPPTAAPAPHPHTPPFPKKALSALLQPGKQLQSHVGESSNPPVRAATRIGGIETPDGAANNDTLAERGELSGDTDKPEFLRKVEEIKQLQCAISINANLALKLSMEVMDVVTKRL